MPSFLTTNWWSFSTIDDNKLQYALASRATQGIQNKLEEAQYRKVTVGWEVAELFYQPSHWKRAHRFLVFRKLKELLEPPVTLFVLKKYAYRILLSELKARPQHIWRFYNQRATHELLIRELKRHYAMVKIPSRRLIANQTYLEIALWTYDLIHIFKHLCLPQRCHLWSASTLRRELWSLPAELVRTHNRNKLRLPLRFPHQDIFSYAQAAAEKVPPLE